MRYENEADRLLNEFFMKTILSFKKNPQKNVYVLSDFRDTKKDQLLLKIMKQLQNFIPIEIAIETEERRIGRKYGKVGIGVNLPWRETQLLWNSEEVFFNWNKIDLAELLKWYKIK